MAKAIFVNVVMLVGVAVKAPMAYVRVVLKKI